MENSKNVYAPYAALKAEELKKTVAQKSYRVTGERVTSLGKNEVFVFGSNHYGHHWSGAAKVANEQFGAEWGVGDGPTGRSYALPTMEGALSLAMAVNRFLAYAGKHPEQTFLVTKVGCGIAGYKVSQVAPLFQEAIAMPWVHLPEIFWKYLWAVNGVAPEGVNIEEELED